MDTVEAVCTRLVVIKRGQLICIGSPQQVRSTFGKGYTLVLKLRAPESDDDGSRLDRRVEELKEFVSKEFGGSHLKHEHEGCLVYNVPRTEIFSWAKLFGTVERAKFEYNIEDYSISQTTLEDVFIDLARDELRQTENVINQKEDNIEIHLVRT